MFRIGPGGASGHVLNRSDLGFPANAATRRGGRRSRAAGGPLGIARNARPDGGDRELRGARRPRLLGPGQPELAARRPVRPRRGARRPVLCAGDSLVKHGLIPKVIAARSGHAAVNLAVARGPAPATFFLFRRALEAGARPAALVVDFKPSVLVGGPRYNVRYWQEILTLRESLDLARSARQRVALLRDWRWGSCCRRSGRGTRSGATCGRPCGARPIRFVRSIAPASGTGRSTTVPTSRPRTPPSTASSGRRRPEVPDPGLPLPPRQRRVHPPPPQRWPPRAGIPVYWLLPPLAPQLQARREQTGAEAGFVRFVRSFQTPTPT